MGYIKVFHQHPLTHVSFHAADILHLVLEIVMVWHVVTVWQHVVSRGYHLLNLLESWRHKALPPIGNLHIQFQINQHIQVLFPP